MKCIVELFGDDRNGRKMIAWGRRIGYVDAGRVCDAERRKVAQTFRPRFHTPRRFAILFPAMLGQSFTEFIFATNTDGSGKAASYVCALDMLGPILTKHYPTPIVGGSMRHSFSLADIHAIREWICTESNAAEAFPDEDIFMTIADDIGFDATGKPTKVNELDEIGAELAKFISKERGDE